MEKFFYCQNLFRLILVFLEPVFFHQRMRKALKQRAGHVGGKNKQKLFIYGSEVSWEGLYDVALIIPQYIEHPGCCPLFTSFHMKFNNLQVKVSEQLQTSGSIWKHEICKNMFVLVSDL